MSNFDLVSNAVKAVMPNNEVKFDNDGNPSVCVYFPKMKNSDLFTGGSDTVHPAFIVNGEEIDGFWYDKYIGCMYNSKMYSLPDEGPKATANYDTFYNAYKNKGSGFHMATAAERAFIALWCVKNGYYPSGNTNYGKDETESVQYAIPDNYDSSGNICRTMTGTGPKTWNHNAEIDGVADMVGNVSEWHAGLRLVYGEIQILENNNAADTSNSTDASSAQWKAIDQNGNLLTPDGNGTTSGSLKIDYQNSVATIVTELTNQSDTDRNCKFSAIKAGDGITIPEILKALMLFPAEDDETYDNGYFYWNNGKAETIARAGGKYSSGAKAWVGYWHLYGVRTFTDAYIGSRGAFIDL